MAKPDNPRKIKKPNSPKATQKQPPKKKPSRIDVPDHVVLELWARAAGRCEYRGCAEPLYLEKHTKARLNKAHVAHIVGAKAAAPRGDSIRSKLLETDFENLMLACRDHHALCDFRGSPEGEERHTEAELRAMKRYFEGFVKNALSMVPKHETHVMTVLGRITGNPTHITKSQIREALWGQQLFPVNDDPDEIKTMRSPELDNIDLQGWLEVRRQTEKKIDRIFEDEPPSHISVFALARIPLLAVVGYKLGDKVPVQTFHPINNLWPWPDPSAIEGFDLIPPSTTSVAAKRSSDVRNVVLKLEVSGVNEDTSLPQDVVKGALVYSVRFAQPRIGGIRSPHQVLAFGEKVRQFYETLTSEYGEAVQHVHVFPAIPPALAVEFGRVVRHHFPPTKLYERRENRWLFALELNDGPELGKLL